MTNLDSIFKSKDITLPTKVRLVKAMVFPVVMYGCESWTIKKAECQRIDAFDLCCWRRLLRVPWTARRSNQSILKEIILNIHWKDWCWSWSSNTLATWCKELTHWKRLWYWERLRAGGEGGDRGWDGWMASPTQSTCARVNSRSWWWTGRPGVLQSMGVTKSRTWRSNWTELNLHTQSCEDIKVKRKITYKSIHNLKSVNLTLTLFCFAYVTSLEKVSESLFIQITQSNLIPLQQYKAFQYIELTVTYPGTLLMTKDSLKRKV